MDIKPNDVSFSPGNTLTNGLEKFEDECDSIIIEVTTVAFNVEISHKHDIFIHIPIAQICFHHASLYQMAQRNSTLRLFQTPDLIVDCNLFESTIILY